MPAIETLDAASPTHETEPRPPPQPGLILVWTAGSPAFAITHLQRPMTLGRRDGGADISIDDPLISRQHARVDPTGGTPMIRDLESRNGLFVGGQRCTTATLSDGATIRVGHSLLIYAEDVGGIEAAIEREAGILIDPPLRQIWRRIDHFATLSRHLLIRGESGTGKELAARRFHHAGGDPSRPFIAVNCAAIPEGVAERLLFGARKGAYSGANADAMGYIQAAHNGALFLDEFGELDLGIQAKLLRFLESGEIIPVGAARPIHLDVRICLATHRDLRLAVAEGRFRDDLYYRVAEPAVLLPPLRHRRPAIPWLAQDVLEVRGRLQAHVSLIERCLTRPWPGNIRELRMAVATATQETILAGRRQVLPEDLPEDAGLAVTPPHDAPSDLRTTKEESPSPRTLQNIDDAAIHAALAKNAGNVAKSARELGVHRNQLRRWLSRHRGSSPPSSMDSAGI